MASSRSATPRLSTSKQQPPSSAARAPTSSPSPTTQPSSTSSRPPAPDLAALVNLVVRITTAGDAPRTLEGTLYTYDPVTSFAVLSNPSSSSSGSPSPSSSPWTAKRDYHLVKTSHIASVSVVAPTPDPAFPPLATPLPAAGPAASGPALAQRVHATVHALEKDRLRRGPRGTSDDVQAVYDALGKTLPVRWTPTGEIVVMDEVVVSPDDAWSIKGGKGSKDRIDRVGKVLEGIRARLAANGGNRTPTIG
ncbi:hypothetical protein JCM11491_002722 [Sporobolomyces phaffii]